MAHKNYYKRSDHDPFANIEIEKGDEKVIEGKIVFVTIGVPFAFSRVPIMQKVSIYVEPTTDTPVTAAKKLRKQVADNIENHGWKKRNQFHPRRIIL